MIKCLVKPNIPGKVNVEEITRDEFNDQLGLLQQQSQAGKTARLEKNRLGKLFGEV